MAVKNGNTDRTNRKCDGMLTLTEIITKIDQNNFHRCHCRISLYYSKTTLTSLQFTLLEFILLDLQQYSLSCQPEENLFTIYVLCLHHNTSTIHPPSFILPHLHCQIVVPPQIQFISPRMVSELLVFPPFLTDHNTTPSPASYALQYIDALTVIKFHKVYGTCQGPHLVFTPYW